MRTHAEYVKFLTEGTTIAHFGNAPRLHWMVHVLHHFLSAKKSIMTSNQDLLSNLVSTQIGIMASCRSQCFGFGVFFLAYFQIFFIFYFFYMLDSSGAASQG